MPVIAVVFDFDDTLVPDSTTTLLAEHGVDAGVLWGEQVPALVALGYDPPMAYLRLLLDMTLPGGPLDGFSNADLRAFGARLDSSFYAGIPQVFDDLRGIAAQARDVAVEFYIVSGGLYEVIVGSQIVRDNFAGIYGCQLDEDERGAVRFIKRAITSTEKTRYLFEINKGIEPAESAKNPGLVNEDRPEAERRVPFTNIIYAGDGLTDIPCFSLVKKGGGISFGIFDPSVEKSAKKTFQQFLQSGRVVGSHAPKFGPEDELGSLLRAAVSAKAQELAVKRSAV